MSLKVYRNGIQEEDVSINPAMAGSYRVAFTGTSSVDTVIITLNDQNYMELSFDFKSGGEPVVVNTYEVNLPSDSGGGNDESSDDISEEGE